MAPFRFARHFAPLFARCAVLCSAIFALGVAKFAFCAFAFAWLGKICFLRCFAKFARLFALQISLGSALRRVANSLMLERLKLKRVILAKFSQNAARIWEIFLDLGNLGEFWNLVWEFVGIFWFVNFAENSSLRDLRKQVEAIHKNLKNA